MRTTALGLKARSAAVLSGFCATFTSPAEQFEAQPDEVLPYMPTLEPT
jgi:hypothetical protein